MTSNLQLMRDAKASLRGKWGSAALAYLVYTLIICASSFAFIGPIILAGPLILGLINFLKQIKAGDSPRMEVLFSGFSDFVRSMLAYLLVQVFVVLWMLLLVVPGIIMAFAYAMTMFIIADPEFNDLSALEAISLSRKMMRGYKMKLFLLGLRFFGWLILCVLTFGILVFWIEPYIQMSFLNFYEDVKAEWKNNNAKE